MQIPDGCGVHSAVFVFDLEVVCRTVLVIISRRFVVQLHDPVNSSHVGMSTATVEDCNRDSSCHCDTSGKLGRPLAWLICWCDNIAQFPVNVYTATGEQTQYDGATQLVWPTKKSPADIRSDMREYRERVTRARNVAG